MLYIATGAAAAVGAAATAWPFISQMNPDAATIAAGAPVDVDLKGVPEGSILTVKWRGNPIFVRHRTKAEIAAAQKDDTAPLPDPETDAKRVKKPEWLIVAGNCTHLGCVPIGQTGNRGEYDGWFCPCHGSHYDTSGRIRKGPAPKNLPVPKYVFDGDTKLTIG